jgi:RNA polymerase sigma-70 factor (ECF subfamily)
LNAWNAIPPQRPVLLSPFLGRITRNLSLDRYKARKAQKRSGDETALLLSELESCIPSGRNVEEEVEAQILERAIDSFLSLIGKDDRMFFVRRYWYADPVAEIAERFAVSQSKVKTSLFRTRGKLKKYLESEGVTI